MDYFLYLGSEVAADGGCEKDVVHRMNQGYRARGVQLVDGCWVDRGSVGWMA